MQMVLICHIMLQVKNLQHRSLVNSNNMKNDNTRRPKTTRRALACASLILSGSAMGQTAQTLPSITVTGSGRDLPAVAPGGQAATGARLGMLGNTDIIDAPVSVNAYTEQVIQDQQARTLADVLQNDPSVRYTTNSGHMLEHFKIRGLDVNGPSVAMNGLYGIAPNGHVPTEFLERVEVLRGPSAMLSGMAPDTNLGGTINLVTKRATAEPILDFTTSYSSGSYGQGHVDIGQRFGDDQRLGVRFNGAYGTGDTGVAEQKKGRQLGAIAIDYDAENWRVMLDAYSLRQTIDNGSQGMYGFATGPGLTHLVDVPDSDTNMFRGTHGEYKDNGFSLRGELDINDNLSAYASVGAANSSGQGLMFGTRVIVTGDDGSAMGSVYNVHTVTRGRVAETGLRGRFNMGTVTHTVNMSANVLRHQEGTNNKANTGWAQNIYNPVTPVFPAAPDAPAYNQIDNVLSSFALTDTLDIADGKVLLTLGARLQRVKQTGLNQQDYDESRLSPSLGIVVKPWGENTSLYANYMEGLSPGQIVPTGLGYLNEGASFKPLQTKQMEIGVKQRLGDFMHTLSGFQIDRPTLIKNAAGTLMTEGGKQRIQGVEWTMFGKITPTISVLGGVSYLNAKQRDTGKDSFGVPNWTANVGLEWATPVTGLSVGGRTVYTGKQWANSANTLRLPSWHRFDLNAKYETKIASTPVTFNLYVENVTDRQYWSGMFTDGYVMPASPRTVRLAATFAF